ncbi:hypothetical protein NM688_g6874 [Phlebia brevispora]|uniref:Uncharacterized protein n=1 Tax=Phlebia brevispora TaxID=194682 RepID=A0ACC1SBM7_9APHY|nr:hypothetical protein NM688_g6874 [Phlebia brevispora]
MQNTSARTSTTSLISVNTTYTSSSTAPLRSDRSSRPKTEEEYLALFGALQNQYGFAGTAPTRPAAFKQKKRESHASTPSSTTLSPSQPRPALNEQERKFGELSAKYGFSGTAPTVPTVPPSDAKSSLKFWKRSAA